MPMGWAGTDSDLCNVVEQQSEACLRVYQEDPSRIEEDAHIELSYAEGGYQRSQLFELMQNATDAMRGQSGRIQLVLTSRGLYAANEGEPFSEQGATTVLASHLSRKSEQDIGQFGLGFKSVLAVSHRPVVYSRSGSFAFDREVARNRIEAAGLSSRRYPVLRLATPVDPIRAGAEDAVLGELIEWAATVIHLPLYRGRGQLAKDLKSVPAEFMLFAPQVTELRLEDREAADHRVIRLESAGANRKLVENEAISEWHVVERAHRPSAAALRDAGELARRSTVDVAWAAPLGGRSRTAVGEFWAHFPTGLKTTLGGILNAPWKLSADRRAMLNGIYNRELLVGVVPDLVQDALPHLRLAGDPGSVLDLLPARGREARSFGDDVINEPVYQAVSKSNSLPDRNGTLRNPAHLTLQPRDLDEDWLSAWSPDDPTAWVHESVDATSERRSKAERLIGLAKGGTATLTSWLEAVVGRPTAESSAAALRLAALMLSSDRTASEHVRKAKIVLLEDETLGAPVRGQVFLRADATSSGHDFLHPGLMSQPDLGDAFATLGIEVLDHAGELRAALQRNPRGAQWAAVWSIVNQMDAPSAYAILREEIEAPLTEAVHARTKAGRWHSLATVFLPGEVIPANSHEDAEFLVDPAFHARHISLLEQCGAVSAPRVVRGKTEPWLEAYRVARVDKYRAGMTGGSSRHRTISWSTAMTSPGPCSSCRSSR